MEFQRDVCYCWGSKKVISKTCVKCNGKLNRLRNYSRDGLKNNIEIKNELELMEKLISDFNNKNK